MLKKMLIVGMVAYLAFGNVCCPGQEKADKELKHATQKEATVTCEDFAFPSQVSQAHAMTVQSPLQMPVLSLPRWETFDVFFKNPHVLIAIERPPPLVTGIHTVVFRE